MKTLILGIRTLLLEEKPSFGQELCGILTSYIFPVLVVLSVVWAIWISIAFGMAKSEQERTNAKARLVKALATIVIVLVLYYILYRMGESLAIKEQ